MALMLAVSQVVPLTGRNFIALIIDLSRFLKWTISLLNSLQVYNHYPTLLDNIDQITN